MGFRHIKKAVFPVAGLGTRFLPLTKDIPKEMMPLIDRPLIHYGVDEAVASGCSEIVFVTGTGKETIYQYFQHSPNLEKLLEQTGRKDLAEHLKKIPELPFFITHSRKSPWDSDMRYFAPKSSAGMNTLAFCFRMT